MRKEGGLLAPVTVGETNVRDPKKRMRHRLWRGIVNRMKASL
jgi:hypothetical protein